MAMEKNYKPKLELKLNETVKVKLLKDKCYEGTNTSGPYYLYSVEHVGIEKSFFAPENVHNSILAHGLRSGSEFMLNKVASKNGKSITGELVFEALSNGKGNGHEDSFRAVMEQSLKEAVEITKAVSTIPFQNEDVQKIASCLFIARTKTNGHSS
jgi:hypothetical protein